MKSTITIEDVERGRVALTIHSEDADGRRVSSQRLFDLVEEAVRGKFAPVLTHFVPIRKTTARRRRS